MVRERHSLHSAERLSLFAMCSARLAWEVIHAGATSASSKSTVGISA
jgi:hypothetical protein